MTTIPALRMEEASASQGLNGSAHVPGYDVSDSYIREAIAKAAPSSLRLALLQVTGDKELERMKVHKKEIRYGWLYDYVLSPEDEEKVREKAVRYLLSGPHPAPAPPSRKESYRLMDLFSGEPLSAAPKGFFDYEEGYEELAFDDHPRNVTWNDEPPEEEIKKWKVLVVGAGISGIAAGVLLHKLRIPFEIVERQAGVGGTWLLNNYPEARVDTLSYLFQYKFVKNYKWTEFFASRAETQKYLSYVSNEYGILENCRFNREVVAAHWDEGLSKWIVTIKHKDGQQKTLEYNAIISASGLFSTPNLPDIPGLKDFKGHAFHTAQWDHSVQYKDRKVAVIGTGSSGTQVTPGLAPHAKQVSVYQRTPEWIVKIEGYRDPVSQHMNWLCDNIPYYWNWFCFAAFFRSLHIAEVQYFDKEWQADGGLINRRNDGLRRALTEFMEQKFAVRPDLLRKIRPRHAPLVRRLVVDNGFYDALKRDNVELVTEGIERITEKGIITMDGQEREFDIIVLAGGFKVSQYLWPVEYVGREGMTLQKAWEKDGARSYLGETMPYYPNLFMMYGPNHQPRGGSLYSTGELWARYAVAAIARMIERGVKAMEVKKDVYNRYQATLDQANKRIIWEMSESGYYVNNHGRQAINMPWTTAEYHQLIRQPNLDDFDLV